MPASSLSGPHRPLRSQRSSELKLSRLSIVLLVVLLLFSAVIFHHFHELSLPTGGYHQVEPLPATLVVYTFRHVDPEAINNLNHFIKAAVLPTDKARYIIALDPRVTEKEMQELSKLPSNAQFWWPSESCFQLGVVGQVLFTSGLVDVTSYRYFVWTDSRVRGPFLPVYADQQLPWHRHLTQLLTSTTRLVGSTISCSGVKMPECQYMQHPHVQDYLMATDQIGLQLMKDNGALSCHRTWPGNLGHGEMAASIAVLRKGYNLGSLMFRYQGIDWRDASKWGCNAMMDPTQDGHYDRISLQAFEVMFVKVSHPLLVTLTPAATQAARIGSWTHESRVKGATDIGKNAWRAAYAKEVRKYEAKSTSCFDAEFYIEASPVELGGMTAADAWQHFLLFGLKEGRPFQFIC